MPFGASRSVRTQKGHKGWFGRRHTVIMITLGVVYKYIV
jgi:hypothetical protein